MAEKIPGLDAEVEVFRVVLGAAVRRERQARRLTIQELARRVGIAKSTLSEYERGKSPIDSYVLVRICWVLGIQVGVLLTQAVDQVEDITGRPHLRHGGDDT